MKKIVFLSLLLFTLSALLASCFGTGGTENKDDRFWASGSGMYISSSDDGHDMALDLSDVIYAKLGFVPTLKAAEKTPVLHEIIIGETENELSAKAYNLLERKLETDELCGYLIYSNGTAVAIAYSNEDMLELAINIFVEKFLIVKSGTIDLKSGTLDSDVFNLYD